MNKVVEQDSSVDGLKEENLKSIALVEKLND